MDRQEVRIRGGTVTFFTLANDGWPIQARFWLEWDVIRRTRDHEQTRFYKPWDYAGRASRRKILFSGRTAPLKPKPGLNGPPASGREVKFGILAASTPARTSPAQSPSARSADAVRSC